MPRFVFAALVCGLLVLGSTPFWVAGAEGWFLVFMMAVFGGAFGVLFSSEASRIYQERLATDVAHFFGIGVSEAERIVSAAGLVGRWRLERELGRTVRDTVQELRLAKAERDLARLDAAPSPKRTYPPVSF